MLEPTKRKVEKKALKYCPIDRDITDKCKCGITERTSKVCNRGQKCVMYENPPVFFQRCEYPICKKLSKPMTFECQCGIDGLFSDNCKIGQICTIEPKLWGNAEGGICTDICVENNTEPITLEKGCSCGPKFVNCKKPQCCLDNGECGMCHCKKSNEYEPITTKCQCFARGNEMKVCTYRPKNLQYCWNYNDHSCQNHPNPNKIHVAQESIRRLDSEYYEHVMKFVDNHSVPTFMFFFIIFVFFCYYLYLKYQRNSTRRNAINQNQNV